MIDEFIGKKIANHAPWVFVFEKRMKIDFCFQEENGILSGGHTGQDCVDV
jgi:hypothetical protein